jgi:menaquinone-specific isochorismate synthase
MSTGSFQRPVPADDASRVVARALLEIANRVESTPLPSEGEFARVEASVEPTDLLHWLRGAPAGDRRYFRDRSSKLEIAGVGTAVSCGFGEHERWSAAPVRSGAGRASAWFVSLPFDAGRQRDGSWTRFVSAPCVLPEFELRRDVDQHVLAAHVTACTDRAALAARLRAMSTPPSECVVEPALVRQSDGTGEADWTRAVRAALERIRSGALRKIVLARTRRYIASGVLDPVAVLARLAGREARGFRFLIEAGAGHAFLGVTPERLVLRSGRVARSEAVAGTRPRGVDGVADRLLGESLLASAKDRREHELVVERVREALAACATSLRVDAEPRLLRLAYVQHLATRVQAELRGGVGDLDLVRALHPTPAVAGAPVADAVAALRDFEPFDRGLYAGPVGVVSRDGAEIAVAIRSARIEGDTLTAFAGAGIVEGSDPAEEWRETGHKLLAFERLAT